VSRYVVTGGTDAFVAELSGHLRLPVDRSPTGQTTAWVHLVPHGRGDESAAVAEAVTLAEHHLPRGPGASFIAVVPVWGVIAPPLDASVEVAASLARALGRVRIEPWSQMGRRFNVVSYGALDASLPGLRDRALLADRTPMHRLATVAELANAIDFLASASASYVTGADLPLDGGWAAYSWFHPARDL
jgi:NAD(P)-dependent dehydrogenase (short-subunit alcohol dehydrogenase family)